jgi:competence protein ComEC
MAARAGLCLLIFFFATRMAEDFAPELIVWNVGQGQWVTLADSAGCWHFDVGGEFAPWAAVMRECRARKNFVFFSHWDWDHVGLIGRARMYLPNICLLRAPQGRGSPRKERQLAGMEKCGEAVPFVFWNGQLGKTANASSRVAVWRGVLIPGDSSRDQEKFWSRELAGVGAARILVLGHHGSATSTGADLLKKAAHIRMAIASARFRRYGHPHPRVIRDLKEKLVPVLRTEDWGTIRIPL